MWLQNGGDATLSSFGLPAAASPHHIPEEYLHFMDQLEWYFETDGYILAHAGLDFRVSQPLQARQSMIWIRDWYGQIDREWLRGRIIVHGHTPVPRPMIINQLKKLNKVPALDIDAGCVFKGNYFKYLCAFDLDNRQLYFQENIETDA
jgi:serine/threonine protein phosphatase 1